MNAWEDTAPRETAAAKSRDLDVVRAQRWAAFPKFGARKSTRLRTGAASRDAWAMSTNRALVGSELLR